MAYLNLHQLHKNVVEQCQELIFNGVGQLSK